MLVHIFRFLVAHLVDLFILSVGLRTQPGTVLRAARARPRLYARALLVLYAGIPLLTIVVAKVLGLRPGMAALLVVFGVCPAAPLVVPRLLRKDAAAGNTALTLVVLASVLAPVLVPLWLEIVNPILGSSFVVAPTALFTVFAGKVFLPLAIGMLVGRASPRIAEKLAPVLSGIGAAALVLAVVFVSRAIFETTRHLTLPTVVAMLLTALGSAALGQLAAGEAPSDRDAVTAVAMTGSPALALAVINTSYPGLANVVGIVGTFLMLRTLAGLPYHLFTARKRRATADPTVAHV